MIRDGEEKVMVFSVPTTKNKDKILYELRQRLAAEEKQYNCKEQSSNTILRLDDRHKKKKKKNPVQPLTLGFRCNGGPL